MVMNDRIVLSEWSQDEIELFVGSLTQTDPEQVCAYLVICVKHNEAGRHELRVTARADDTTDDVVSLLEHTLKHAKGYCAECAAEAARRSDANRE